MTLEASTVHRSVNEWNASTSVDRRLDRALGVDPLTLKLMRCAMKSWPRVQFLGRYFAGTVLPRLQMD